MEQTAVEWLALRYHHRQGYLSLEDIEKAKEMEKEQMKNILTKLSNNENNTQNKRVY